MNELNSKKSHLFSFSGQGFEYFKIWIVNILLSIVTLGIYSAWAKVRTNRYFYGNTFLDGTSFDYHATGWSVLKGRIIAFIALLIYVVTTVFLPIGGTILAVLLGLLIPLIIWSSLRFNARMSSYRNVRFGFVGRCLDVYKYILFIPAIPFGIGAILIFFAIFSEASAPFVGIVVFFMGLAVFMMIPWTQALFSSYFLNNLKFGQGQFDAKISIAFFYKTYFKAFGVGLFGSAIVVGVLYLLGTAMGLDIDPTLFQNAADPEAMQAMILTMLPIVVLLYLSLFFIMMLIRSYINVTISNYTFAQLKFDSIAEFSADYSLWPLVKLQITNLFLFILTLGLAYPWIKVRMANFTANGLNFIAIIDLSKYLDDQKAKKNALADELGEAFDADVDLGLTF